MTKDFLLKFNIFVDNNYLDKYLDLINKNLDTKCEKFKTQQHHIVPRYYYNDLGLDIDNSETNKVNLLFKDHILAHYYLSLCSIDKFKYNNEYAFIGMTNRDYLSIDDYNDIISLEHYQVLYEDSCKRNSDMHIGKMHTQETKDKMSKSRKGYKTSIQTRDKIRNSNRGKYVGHIWIHRGKENKHISPDDFELYESQGFVRGRFQPEAFKKMRENNHMHTGMLGKHQSTKQKEAVRQACKNRVITDETRRKMSESAKNRNKK